MIRKKILIIAISAILLIQLAPFTKAKPDLKGYTDTDYGAHRALVNLLNEKDNKTGSLDIETQEKLNKSKEKAENIELDKEKVEELNNEIANVWKNVTVDTKLKNVELKNILKIEHLVPHVFEVVEGNETVASWWETFASVFTEGFYKFYIKYIDDNGKYERVLNFSLVDSLFGLLTEGVSWKTIDIEPDNSGNYNDNQFFNDWDIKARIYPDIDPNSVKLVYGDNEISFFDVIANPIYYTTQVTLYIITNLGSEDFDWPHIIFSGGLMFEILERDDREIAGILEISALRGVGYNNSRYVWVIDSTFPKNEVPDEYTFYITAESFRIDIIGGVKDDAENFAQNLINLIIGGPVPVNEVNITSLNPPYKIGYELLNDTNIEERGLSSLELLGGYVKVEEKDGSYKVVDRVWIKAKILQADGGIYDKIPYKGVLTISTKEENGEAGPETVYDSIQWNAPIECKVNMTYTEEEKNRTYIFANFSNMPSYFKIKLNNESTEEETLSELYYETSSEINYASYDSYIYRRHSKNKDLWFCNETHISLQNIPTNFTVKGTFELKAEKDRFTLYNNPNIDLVGRLLDNIMLRIASKVYAVGMELRGIPSSIMDIPGKGGWFHLRFQDNITLEDDYIGMIEFWHSSNKFLWIENSNEDFLALYNETEWAEDYPRIKEEVTDIPISGRISGIGELYYESYDKNTSVEICTGAHDSRYKKFKKPFRFFYREPHDYYKDEYQNEETIYDYAEVKISDIPTDFRLNVTEEEVKYYSTESLDLTYTSLIRRDRYSEHHIWDYMRFHIGEIPSFLSFYHRNGTFIINTEPSDEDGKILDDLKIKIEDTHKYINFDFLISDDVNIENHTVIYHPLIGNYISLYQNNVDIEGKDEIKTMSGNFEKLKYIHYKNETQNGKVFFKIDKVKDNSPIRIAVKNDTIREHYSAIDGLEAYAIIAPMPSHIEVRAEKSKKEDVSTPEITNISSIADVVKLIHAVEDMGNSIVDMICNLTTGVLNGLGEFQSNASFDFEFIENIDIIISIKKGDMDLLEEDTRWVQGICARQKTIKVLGNDEVILNAKIFLEGLPTKGDITMKSGEDWTFAKIYLENYNPYLQQEDNKYLLIDIKGMKKRNILVYFDLNDIKNAIDIEANVDMTSDEKENRINGTFGFNITSHEGGHDVTLGAVYINIKDFSENPYFAEAYLPSLPASFYSYFDSSGPSINYKSNSPIDYIIAEIGIGNENEVLKIAKKIQWCHGASIIQNKVSNKTITSAKIYLTGLPNSININLNKNEENAKISVDIDNWEPSYDWILLEARGIDNKNDIKLFQNNLRNPIDLKIDVEIEVNTSMPKDKLNAKIEIDANKDLGQTYLKVRNYENKAQPMIIEAFLPKIPSSFSADISITENIKIETESKIELEFVWIRVERFIDMEMYAMTVILHKLPEKFYVSLVSNPDRDFSLPLYLQGYPNIEIRTYDAMHFIDINLNIDGRVMGNRGYTKLHAEHVPDKTTLFLNGDVYSIRSPQKIDFVFYEIGDLPIQKEYYLKSIKIYSEDIKCVDICAKNVFGAYPVFELNKCNAKFLQFSLRHKITILGRSMDLRAVIIDIKLEDSTRLPMLSPVTVNGITTKMDSKQYLIPEPISTIFATILT